MNDAELEAKLVVLDAKLATGWRPKGRPVEEVVADLRARARESFEENPE